MKKCDLTLCFSFCLEDNILCENHFYQFVHHYLDGKFEKPLSKETLIQMENWIEYQNDEWNSTWHN